MAVSFGGVVMTAFSVTKGDNDGEGEAKRERAILTDNDSLAAFVGCAMIILAAIINGGLAVQTRILQHIDVFVTVFFVLALSAICQGAWIVVEFWVGKHEHFRLFEMSYEQFLGCLVSTVCNFC